MWSFVRLEKPEEGAAASEARGAARAADKREPAAGKDASEEERE